MNFTYFLVTNVFTVEDKKSGKNGKRGISPVNPSLFNGAPKNSKTSNLPASGSPTVSWDHRKNWVEMSDTYLKVEYVAKHSNYRLLTRHTHT